MNHVAALAFAVIVVLQLLILRKQTKMSHAQDRISAQIARLTTVDAGLKTLVTDLVGRIRSGSGDQAAMNKLADDLEAQVDSIVADVKVGTDAEEEIVPPADAGGGEASTQEAGGGESTVAAGGGADVVEEG